MLASLMDVVVIEWTQSIYPTPDTQILILIHYASTYHHWKYLTYAFQTPILLVATADNSDYA